MAQLSKKQSNAFSTGGGGSHFEAHVQASFVALMLSGGYAPALPCWPITEIKLQGKIDGYDTDDLIVFVSQKENQETRRLLGQIKHAVKITPKDQTFKEVMQAAWNDFNNQRIFTKDQDVIALITSHLTATDATNVLWLLEHAKTTKNVDEFNLHVNQANFSPSKCQEKLKAIKHHLKLANGNIEVPEEELYAFLNHFYILGYDLGGESGVLLSLLHSHISQYHPYPHWLWSRIVDVVQTWNQNAGTITIDNLPEDLVDAFSKPKKVEIPKSLVAIKSEPKETDWKQHPHATDFAITSLIGSWSENNVQDLAVLSHITGQQYEDFAPKIREALVLADKPFAHKNGIWKMPDRKNTWNKLGSRLFDDHLDKFKTAAISVLSESDPSFDLPPDERYAASIYGKTLTHSGLLRKGIAEGLAVLRYNKEQLSNCSLDKVDSICDEVIQDLLDEADWIRWGSLNDMLPVLAEGAPDTFLNAIEKSLSADPCPFDTLFQQEGSGTFGRNYLTGLLWALEGLAWDENYLVRVCVVLGDLAACDPGGNWANRPANSLTTILLPWLPQTIAKIEKRKAAIQIVVREQPVVGWSLLLSLLPDSLQSSSGSYKPTWRRSIPDNWEKGVTRKDYWEVTSFSAELAVSMSRHDVSKIRELIDRFDHLPKPAFDQLLEILSSAEIQQLPEEKRLELWQEATKLTHQHRRYADADWALNDELLTSIENAVTLLAPKNPFNLHQYLFTDDNFDLYEEGDDWDAQHKLLNERRKNAIQDILISSGLEQIIQFANLVKSPQEVGLALAETATPEVDAALLPGLLTPKESNLIYFIRGYVWKRRYMEGWKWVDSLDRANWNTDQMVKFLGYLPFNKETWDRASQWLDKTIHLYWETTPVTPYDTDENLNFAVDQLLKHNRPVAAIDLLTRMNYKKQPFGVKQCAEALIGAISSTEQGHMTSAGHKLKLIKVLQDSPETSDDDLFRVEWAYLRLLDGRHGYPKSKYLTNKLASDAKFFCEMIQFVYRSKHEDKKHRKPSAEDETILATQVWHLLNKWETVPGMDNIGHFSPEKFCQWIKQVESVTTESGHLEVAFSTIGQVLIHAPADNGGLWIHHTIAEIINQKEMSRMRDGYERATYNSRGIHTVDPSGKPELKLADKFKQRADAVENSGYQRFARTLRNISERYVRESERVIEKCRYDEDD